MANKFVTFFDVDGARKNGWSEASIRDMLSRIEKINRGEQEQEQESESEQEQEQELDISLLPDNNPMVPLNVLYARREQMEDLYYTYGDADVFDRICNITGIINAREEEKNHENI